MARKSYGSWITLNPRAMAAWERDRRIQAAALNAPYVVKCDECKAEIRHTNDIRESYAGGRCQSCKNAS